MATNPLFQRLCGAPCPSRYNEPCSWSERSCPYKKHKKWRDRHAPKQEEANPLDQSQMVTYQLAPGAYYLPQTQPLNYIMAQAQIEAEAEAEAEVQAQIQIQAQIHVQLQAQIQVQDQIHSQLQAQIQAQAQNLVQVRQEVLSWLIEEAQRFADLKRQMFN